jgi:hypothetical protein
MLLLLLGCPPKTPVGPPDVEGTLPVLPAPDAPIYSAAPGTPSDPLVAWAVGDRVYDDALGGAAAGLAEFISAMGGHDEAAVHWACLRAGWPYGVGRVVWERSPHDTAPPSFVAELEGETAPVGVARYRDAQSDIWVLITGRIQVLLPPIDREPEIGDTLSLKPTASGWSDWQQRVLPPNGDVKTGAAVFGEPGEWLLELSAVPTAGGDRYVVARLPLYVGEQTPPDGPFLQVDLEKPAASAAPELALPRLNVMRSVLGAEDLEDDALLDSAARKAMAGDGHWTAAGYDNGAVMECTGNTVRGCLDDLFWDIDGREGLRDPELKAVGVAAEWTEAGLHMVVMLGG